MTNEADGDPANSEPESPGDVFGRLPAGELFERLPVPMLVVDRSGVIVRANSAAAVVAGWSPGALTGLGAAAVVAELDDETDPLSVLRRLVGAVVTLRGQFGSRTPSRLTDCVALGPDDALAVVLVEDIAEPRRSNPVALHTHSMFRPPPWPG